MNVNGSLIEEPALLCARSPSCNLALLSHHHNPCLFLCFCLCLCDCLCLCIYRCHSLSFPLGQRALLPIQRLNSLTITIFVLSFVFESAVKTLEDNETLYILFCQLSKCVVRGPKDEISFGRRLFANTVGPRRCPDSHNILSLQKRK